MTEKNIMQRKEEMNARHNKRQNKIFYGLASGALVGLSWMIGGTAKLAYIGNSYRLDQDIVQYRKMDSTLNTLRLEKNRAIPEFDYQSKEMEPHINRLKLAYSENEDNIENAIATVENDIENLKKANPEVSEYEHWKSEGLDRMIGWYYGGGLTLIFSSAISGIYFLLMDSRKREKELEEIQKLQTKGLEADLKE